MNKQNKTKSWEERFDEMWDKDTEFLYEFSWDIAMTTEVSDIRNFIAKEIDNAVKDAIKGKFFTEIEVNEKTVIGVSQWKKLGKKYGYWDYFKKEAVKEREEELLEKIKEYKFEFKLDTYLPKVQAWGKDYDSAFDDGTDTAKIQIINSLTK